MCVVIGTYPIPPFSPPALRSGPEAAIPFNSAHLEHALIGDWVNGWIIERVDGGISERVDGGIGKSQWRDWRER